MDTVPLEQHNIEIQKNLDSWNRKPLLQEIYKGFYKKILSYVRHDVKGEIIELGSGIGNFKMACKDAIATDIFPNPWIDRVENAYHISSLDSSVSNLVLFDVFHHLQYPGLALQEFHRVLAPGGRVIIFDPYISLLGFLVYGVFHHEPIGWRKHISWMPELSANPNVGYYAAQGNATRIFARNSTFRQQIKKEWNIIAVKKYSHISYVLSGGFSKPALYPIVFLPVFKIIDSFLNIACWIFGTRTLVVLEKK